MAEEGLGTVMRNYIRIVEAANRGCPVATYDIDVNLRNRQKAIDNYEYGPANPDEPGDIESNTNCSSI